jgi:hypothetical protein
MNYGPKTVTNGLILAVDAADKNSYVGSGTTWIGRIATTSVYIRTLSSIEILQNYNATKSRFGL